MEIVDVKDNVQLIPKSWYTGEIITLIRFRIMRYFDKHLRNKGACFD